VQRYGSSIAALSGLTEDNSTKSRWKAVSLRKQLFWFERESLFQKMETGSSTDLQPQKLFLTDIV